MHEVVFAGFLVRSNRVLRQVRSTVLPPVVCGPARLLCRCGRWRPVGAVVFALAAAACTVSDMDGGLSVGDLAPGASGRAVASGQTDPPFGKGDDKMAGKGAAAGAQVPPAADLTPALRPGTAVAGLARAALAESDRTSPGLDLVEQRILERVATGRKRWPLIAPVAELDHDGNARGGVGATVTLHDFGRSKAQRAQADRAIELARLDLWQERIDSVQAALGYLIDASEAKALREASAASLVEITQLRQFAQSRVGAGIADKSEELLFDVRLAELRNQIAADKAALQLALGQISVSTKQSFSDASVPSLAMIEEALAASSGGGRSPDLLRARLQYALAEHQQELVGARRFPALQLRGAVLSDGRDITPTASLSLETSDFPGLAAGPSLFAARSSVSSARANVAKVLRDLEVEARRISLERARLESRTASLATLAREARLSVDLFLDQQDIGGRPLTDGITVHRTLLETRRGHVSVRAGLLRLRIEEVARNGMLVRQGGP